MSDTQSTMEELADDPSSRKRFLKMVGGAGAASAFAVFLAACGSDDETGATAGGGDTSSGTKASGKDAKKDLEIVNYALTLEYLEAEFYNQVIDSGQVKDKKIAELAKKIGENEQEHVDALTATVEKLGGTPAPKPKTKFEDVISGGPDTILKTAAEVENLGAAAYLGQAGKITGTEVLAAALSIHSVEARHASALNTLLGKSATPDGAFAKPASMAKVLKAVKPFIAS
jgi:rubrerythrin